MQVQRPIEVHFLPSGMDPHHWGLTPGRPYRGGGSLQVHGGFILGHNHDIRSLLGQINQFFSSWASNSATGASLRDLYRRKPGPIATTPLVGQSGYANSKILAAPFHESRSTAPGDFHYLLAGVAGAVQADCLVAGTGRTIFTVGVSIGEFLDLLLGQLESSSCHTPIVWLLIDLSIRDYQKGLDVSSILLPLL